MRKAIRAAVLRIAASVFALAAGAALQAAHTQALQAAHTQALQAAHTQALQAAHTQALQAAHTQALQAPLVAQGLKITYRTEAKMLLVTSKGTEVEYHSEHYMLAKNDKEKRDMLLDYRDFATYDIDHKKKTIGKTALEDTLRAVELVTAKAAELEKDSAKAEKADKAMKRFFGEAAELAVKKVGTEQIAGRNCEKWDIALGKFSCRASADPSLAPPNPDALEKANKLKSGVLLAYPMLGKTLGKFFDAIYSIKGIQLKSEVVMTFGPMTARMSKEATELEQGPIPASVFELPKGYKEEDAGKKMLADLEKSLNKKK